MSDWKYLNDFKRKYVYKGYQRKSWNDMHFPLREKQSWTDDTMRTTIEICMWAWKNGYAWMTEVKMLSGSRRADVVIPELGTQIIEIYDSEGFESINQKKEEYENKGLIFLAVPADPEKAISLIKEANNL